MFPFSACKETFLIAGTIHSSSSTAEGGFFLVEKKDGLLHPCIDYRDFSKITIKNQYLVPLSSSVLYLLLGARIFTKLDLWEAHHVVWIRERTRGRLSRTGPNPGP